MDKPFAPACERNKQVILEILQTELKTHHQLIEIGSGTGQHAVFFGKNLEHITWQTSDRGENHPGIQLWLDEAHLENVLNPIEFDVDKHELPLERYDAAFTANTFHIMSWEQVCRCIQKIGNTLKETGTWLIYGPFNFQNQYTSQSNQEFDKQLRAQDPNMGIRNFEAIEEKAKLSGLTFYKKYSMPANNMILIFKKGV